MKIKTNKIKNIIFDLGEVFTDIHFDKTIEAFSQLAKKDAHYLYNNQTQTQLFDKIETGSIAPKDFIHSLQKIIAQANVSDQEIINAWNALMGNTPLEKLEWAKQLRPQFKTFLLSNTNFFHIEWLNADLQKRYGISNLNPFFDKVYFSHEIGFRKPNVEAFTYVLEKESLKAEETLFIDDRIENIEGAQKAGLQTFHLTDKSILMDLF